ncbi:MAG: SPOR domain-containing protein [Saprospiraceae bacterium]|nr:SPOR domain-containing protein [Saprospiraceae bacterium]
MALDIGQIIGELLYEYDTITIPGFGAITMYYQAADIDVLQGKLNPPKKEVNFNSNIVINDGLLADHIHIKYGVSLEAAQESIDYFVKDLQARLQRGDAFELASIGKFYTRNQEIQFTPNVTNFNADAYGLPKVQFFPIAKTHEGKIQFNPSPVEETIPIAPPPPREWGWTLQWIIPALALLALGLTLYSLRDSLFKPSAERLEAQTNKPSLLDETVSPDLKVNQKPIATPATTVENTEEKSVEEAETESKTDQATLSPNQKEKVVIIGAFQDKQNAEQLVKEIVKAGYNPISETRNGKRYVGIRYGYEEESAFENAFTDIKKRFNKDAWVLNE